jgi:2-pyrone-4,6-dicarboxylate lactonase
MSLSPDEKPAFTAPVGACDAHFHVFGPAERYPADASAPLRYALPLAPLSDYLQLAERLGLTRFVFVQPSAYGRDNRCMLDAMREIGPARCRGIVDIAEDAPDAHLADLHALGVRGVRINVSPVHPPQAGLAEAMLPRIRTLAARCKELGWQLDFLLPGWLTLALMPQLRALRLPFTLAHMGMNLAKDGVQTAGCAALLELLAHGEGFAHVKFTGIYRISKLPGFADVDALAQALIAQAPDRIIWGSDYPHLSFADNSSVELFNLLGRWTDSADVRRQILVDTPTRLFDFPA